MCNFSIRKEEETLPSPFCSQQNFHHKTIPSRHHFKTATNHNNSASLLPIHFCLGKEKLSPWLSMIVKSHELWILHILSWSVPIRARVVIWTLFPKPTFFIHGFSSMVYVGMRFSNRGDKTGLVRGYGSFRHSMQTVCYLCVLHCKYKQHYQQF